MHLKTALVDVLYAKSLRLSGAAKSDMGIGAIVNLQSNDAAKLWGLPQYLYVGLFHGVLVIILTGGLYSADLSTFISHHDIVLPPMNKIGT